MADIDELNNEIAKSKPAEPVPVDISGRRQNSAMEGGVNDSDVAAQINYIMRLLDTVKTSNSGLENGIDAQCSFIQDLVLKCSKYAEKGRAKHSPDLFFRSKNNPKDLEHKPLYLNQLEVKTLALLQNSILSHQRVIDCTIEDLYCTLQSSLPKLFASVTEPIASRKIHLPSTWIEKEIDNTNANYASEITINDPSVHDDNEQEQACSQMGKGNDLGPLDKTDLDLEKRLVNVTARLETVNECLQQQFKLTTPGLSECTSNYKNSKIQLAEKPRDLPTLQEKPATVSLGRNKGDEEKVILNQSVEDLQKEIDILTSKLKKGRQDYEDLDYRFQNIKLEKEEISKQNSDLEIDRSHLQVEIQDLKQAFELMKTKKGKIELEKNELSKTNSSLKGRIDKYELKIDNLSDENEKLLSDLEGKNLVITELSMKIEQGDQKCKNMEMENISLYKQMKELDLTNKDMKDNIQNKNLTIENLQIELQTKDYELQDNASEIKGLKENLTYTEEELHKVSENVKTLKMKLREKSFEYKQLMECNSVLSSQSEECGREYSRLTLELSCTQSELENLKKWKKDYDDELKRQQLRKKAILYIPRRGDLVNMVVSDMSARLISLFEKDKSGLEFEEVDSVTKIKPNTPVLVFCINASRLGTDVSNALSGIRVNPQVAVIVLHHKEQHALPNQSSERVLTSTEYKSIGGIYDMACLSSKGGLYDCDLNTAALRALFEFIKQRNVQ